MSREVHVQFCESLGVRFPGATHLFFQARDRRREIKDQIRELQKGLERQRPRRRSHSVKKKRKRAGK